MKRILLSCIASMACVSALCASDAFAWNVQIEDNEHMPPAIVVVDKGAQRLMYLEKHSPLTVRHAYPSIHGGVEGDKEIEGDLKTPEGVYFVRTKIKYPLNFKKYGSQAHALNYPNPIDKMRGKTGGGIWIHSKGDPIETQKTEGCIAIDLDDIAELEPFIGAGTPVLVAQGVLHASLDLDSLPSEGAEQGEPRDEPSQGEVSGEPIQNIDIQEENISNSSEVKSVTGTEAMKIQRELVQLTQEWNTAWASRSQAFFDFYDGPNYTKAQGETFERFSEQKNYLFNAMNWLHIEHEKINILQGPGYWVTWFNQYYRAPNIRTEGVRRLYWQADGNGTYKIVGMEWIASDLGLEQKFLDNAHKTIPSFIDAWRLAWKEAEGTSYASFYKKNAVQDSIKTRDAIVMRKNDIWKSRKPSKLKFSDMTINIRNDAVYVTMRQDYADTSGYKDVGMKELILYPQAGSWIIAHEKWTRK